MIIDEANDQVPDVNATELMLEEVDLDSDPVRVTFATGIYESDLVSFLERARRLAGEVC